MNKLKIRSTIFAAVACIGTATWLVNIESVLACPRPQQSAVTQEGESESIQDATKSDTVNKDEHNAEKKYDGPDYDLLKPQWDEREARIDELRLRIRNIPSLREETKLRKLLEDKLEEHRAKIDEFGMAVVAEFEKTMNEIAAKQETEKQTDQGGTAQNSSQQNNSGTKAADSTPDPDTQKIRELSQHLFGLMYQYVDSDNPTKAIAGARVVAKYDDLAPRLYDAAAVTAYAANEFELAQQVFAKMENLETSRTAAGIKDIVDKEVEKWKREVELRAKEEMEDNLPRVQLETSAGTFVLELFENEAPDTVGNFISLVESGAYDDKTFHRVIKNFMAQGGCPKGDGSGGPGYNIHCECLKPDARMHFRGSLSMAHAGKDTGGSQFFITLRPTPHLDGLHTVFGRVIEGMDNLSKINRVLPGQVGVEPTKIIKATVLRKRDHEYKPNKVGEKDN
jgi:cyclophilin family peptidyl-prolyl cis-trans isomerase